MLNKFTFYEKKFEFNINDHCKSLIEKNEMNWNRIGKLGTKLGINTRLVKNEYGQLQSIEKFLTWWYCFLSKQMTKKNWQQTFKTG